MVARSAMVKMIPVIISIIIFSFLNSGYAAETVTSPDGQVQINIGMGKFSQPFPVGNYLFYEISYAGKIIVQQSPVRISLQKGQAIGAGLKIVDKTGCMVDEVSELPYGKTSNLHDYCNELTLYLQENSGARRRFSLTARAYNDAVAFRLQIPRQPELKNLVVRNEETYVRLHPGTAYALPLKHFQTPYENNYTILPTSELQSLKLIGMPLLVGLDSGPWVAITEADLDDYPGMYLTPFPGEKNTLVSRLAPLTTDSTIAAKISTPHDLPWRVFMISDSPGKLIESNVILNLSKPNKIENTAWIKPGKVAWPWWSGRVVEGRDFNGGMNTATMKYYTDFAANAGLEYLLIDAEWYGKHDTPKEDITTTIPEVDLPEIIRYADSKGVGIFLWVYWECVRDQMQKAFPLYEKWGIKGVKVDYMNRDDQDMVNFYRDVVNTAARYHLLVDFHGAYKPTGLRRAYPNLIVREGVLGMEYSKWSERCNPGHELILPYTRMLAGPMDFTPGAFHVADRENFKAQFTGPMAEGTRAHQLAMYVVYESPLQMVVDHPASFFGQIGYQFLKDVPSVWDETKFLDGKVGDYIVMARRNGEDWYLGAMTDWTARDLNLPLIFLGEGKYMAQIYKDGPNAGNDPTQVAAEIHVVTATDSLPVSLASGGGCAVRFVPTWTPE